jgi:hypothetical protein
LFGLRAGYVTAHKTFKIPDRWKTWAKHGSRSGALSGRIHDDGDIQG